MTAGNGGLQSMMGMMMMGVTGGVTHSRVTVGFFTHVDVY